MKPIPLIALLLTLCCLSPLRVKSQDAVAGDILPAFTGIVFPPLSILIDSALAHNAMVRFREQGVTAKECNVRTQQTYWTRNFGLQADIRYGTFDNFSTNTSEGQSPSIFATRSNQTNYGVGAYMKFPLADAINRKTQVKMALTELEQAESMADVQRDELKQLVIKQYNELILKQRLLKIKSRYLETARVNMEMVEKQFRNGIVPVSEYSRISEIASKSESDFEIARTEFITSYMIMEEIVGFRFIKNITTNDTYEAN